MFLAIQKWIRIIARPDLNEVTDAILKGVTLKHPKLFYRCSGYHDILIWIIGLAPEILLDIGMNFVNQFCKSK